MQIKPSLRGLFETITIEPLPANEALILAEDVLAGLAENSNIRFLADSAKVALDTAAQYLGGSGLPGSALLMLKLSAIRAKDGDEAIGPQQILETLSQLSGLPVSILDTREQLDLKSVRDFFSARVIGQDEAVEAMVGRIAMLKAGLNDPNKPIGVFLLAGPTGTGKTELAKAITEFLFGSVERMIRLDMSEFQTHESIGKILSASADADSLINRVRKQPFSVLLLDEFEKSHPMIWDLFLQAFDEGRLTDAVGQVADLRHCLIILTSNLGATAHRSLGLGFAPQADEFSKEQVMRAIAQTYRPEFQNRLDKVIVFRPLTRELMRGILKKELAALLDRRGLKDRTWAIEWESSALEFLLEKGFSPEMGARPLKRAIDQYLVAPLAAIIVEKRFPEGDQFLFVRSDGEGIQVEFVDPDADSGPSRTGLADTQCRRRADCAFGACFGDPRAAGQPGRISNAPGRIRGRGARTQRRRMDRSQRPADRRHGVVRFLEPDGSLRHAGALRADGSRQIRSGNRECVAWTSRTIQPVAAAIFRRAVRPFRAATAPHQGGHQGRARKCTDRAGLDDRPGVRRGGRAAGDTRLVPQFDGDVSRLGRETPHADQRPPEGG